MNEPYSSKVIETLAKEGEYIPEDILDRSPDGKLFLGAVQNLVNANILRYTSSGSLQWHGRPQHQFKAYHLQ